ncbi:TPA: hypothetical protein OUM20_003406 [Clostridioides difficile]|nr:hypothetical protein [Clostridioides difficile]MBY1102920.1 hypothetical protein [Clostridioides difficile]MCI9919014.1 hypothetical protein [Clostridioides difficile]MCI9926123.1 hypothetical protein [Clostridioides difficile]MCI9929812.1 hypothetical protein [Clostridioides difficile]MDC9477915.1 hypothetical protein [Clostridioides difficile]
MLDINVFWIFLPIFSTIIEWIVLKFLLNKFSELRKNKFLKMSQELFN